MLQRISLAVAALTTLAAGGAQAHHSRAMFDLTKHVELSGSVREFQWTNPHCYIQLTVTDAKGQSQEWTVEMGPPHSLKENGWGKFTLKPGDRIKLTLNPLRSGGNGGELESVELVNGKPVTVGA